MNAIRYKKLIHYRKQVDDALFIPMSLIKYFYQTEFGFIAFMMFLSIGSGQVMCGCN